MQKKTFMYVFWSMNYIVVLLCLRDKGYKLKLFFSILKWKKKSLIEWEMVKKKIPIWYCACICWFFFHIVFNLNVLLMSYVIFNNNLTIFILIETFRKKSRKSLVIWGFKNSTKIKMQHFTIHCSWSWEVLDLGLVFFFLSTRTWQFFGASVQHKNNW